MDNTDQDKDAAYDEGAYIGSSTHIDESSYEQGWKEAIEWLLNTISRSDLASRCLLAAWDALVLNADSEEALKEKLSQLRNKK